MLAILCRFKSHLQPLLAIPPLVSYLTLGASVYFICEMEMAVEPNSESCWE